LGGTTLRTGDSMDYSDKAEKEEVRSVLVGDSVNKGSTNDSEFFL